MKSSGYPNHKNLIIKGGNLWKKNQDLSQWIIEMMKIIPRYCRIMRVMREIPKEKMISKLKIISIAPLLAENVKRTHEGLPMGVVYEQMYKKLEKKLK